MNPNNIIMDYMFISKIHRNIISMYWGIKKLLRFYEKGYKTKPKWKLSEYSFSEIVIAFIFKDSRRTKDKISI